MKDTREFWIRDLEQLLNETVVEDAVAQIMERFDDAVKALHPDSRALIERHFDGVTVEQLARENAATPQQVRDWIERIKREVAQQIRTKCLVKQ